MRYFSQCGKVIVHENRHSSIDSSEILDFFLPMKPEWPFEPIARKPPRSKVSTGTHKFLYSTFPGEAENILYRVCLLYTSPSPRDS